MVFGKYFKTSTAAAAARLENEKASGSNEPSAPESTPGPPPSRPRSTRSFRSSTTSIGDEAKHHVTLSYIFQHQQSCLWISDASGEQEGAMIRKSRHSYLCSPPHLSESPLVHAMDVLNVQAALTISSKMIKAILKWNSDAVEVPISGGQRIQIVPEINDLLRARRHQYAAFIASEAILVVWDDDKLHLLERATTIEEELIRYLWNAGNDETEKQPDIILADCEADEESGAIQSDERPIHYYHSVLVACSICLVTVLQGLGYQNVALDVIRLHRWESLAFLALTPISVFLSLFFSSVCVGVVAQLAGPITCLYTNSKFYSAHPPKRLYDKSVPLPHVTIQCPVYKEGLISVIIPTIRSIKRAISTYELQGGSANIFINDDGMQVIPEEDRQARIQFYEDYGIGWTARPGHGQNGFERKGKFKKASNMNYGLSISSRVEEKLQQIDRPYDWSQADEVVSYERCLLEVLAEGDNTAWADGNIRMGDYVLLIDSDTRVPEDCLLDAVSEMEQSPRVAIIQFSSGVMQVAHDFFENGITFFTNLIYSAIRFGVSSGDVAPFVGHNAILRWSAIQQVSFCDQDDGREKFWSESHVSEDFDMALRLQVQGYVIRFAAWAGDGFKEGVSLTVYDELTRWEKYAYGCNELVFHPIRTWLWRGGPFTPLFRRFVASSMPVGSKINIIAYIGTYYAIGAAWVFILANYVAVGLYNGYLDKWYVESWRVWISVTVVFSGAANLALAVQRYRLDQRTFIGAFAENFKWCIMFSIFFGGISIHVSQAILCHMFEINMQWGATSKEVEAANFFTEVPKVAKKFKWSLGLSIFMILAIIVMAEGAFIPWSWNINLFVAIFPLALMCSCHILLPIALNPGLMVFFW